MLLERAELLDRLTALLAEADRGRGRLVIVGGEAGIGKTSLVRAFADRAGRRAEILVGSCDSVVPARPFGPLHDIARQGRGDLRAALDTLDRDRILKVALDVAASGPRPRVVVLEDLHWADEATLDLIRVIGRRLAGLRALLIGTVRDHDVSPEHPLRLALGELPAGTVTDIPVPPLTPAAVAELARNSDHDPTALHAITGGNPFFVTEALAVGGADVPATVRDAVLARLRRLSSDARQTAHAVAVLGQDSDAALVTAVAERTVDALAECVGAGILIESDGRVRFRHELARRATLGALPRARREELHGRALAELRQGDRPVGAATLAYHAIGARDRGSIVELAPLAGRVAASLGAHREAAAHYQDAIAAADEERLDDLLLAGLLEAHARESAMTDDVRGALASQERALGLRRRLGDVRAEAECVRYLSFVRWLAGDATAALEIAAAAVALLDGIRPEPAELAGAEATLAQRLAVNGGDDEAAAAHARRALALAKRHADEQTAVHALTTLGMVEIYRRRDEGWTMLEESLRRARAAGLDEDVTRALINIVETARDVRRYDIVDRYSREALAWAEEHELDLYHRLLVGRLADIAFERGDWATAERLVGGIVTSATTANPVRTRALALVGRLHARRGDADPWPALDAAAALVDQREGQDLAAVHLARAEAAGLAGRPDDVRREAARLLAIASMEADATWWWSEAWFWAWKAGAVGPVPASVAEPFRLHAEGRHHAAAEYWRSVGRPYEEALALADSAAPADLRAALATFLRLGARPMAQVVTTRLRDLGERTIPRGPRAATRHNPHGLTERELEILRLLAERLPNADIAARLVLSPKTVDHHVSAILRKLGVTSRRDAAAIAGSVARQDGDRLPAN